jgi:hypothetical protein
VSGQDPVEAVATEPPPAEPEREDADVLPWEVGEVVRCGWHAFRASWGVLGVSAALLAWVPELPFALADFDTDADDATHAMRLRVAAAMGLLLGAWLQAGVTRMWIAAARGQRPRLALLLVPPTRLGAILGTFALYAAAVVAGAAALGIGAFVALAAFGFAMHFTVDGDMSPIQAMRASWRLTRGRRAWLFLLALPGTAFGWGAINVSFPGSSVLAACIVAPVLGVAAAVAFLRMSGKGALRAALPAPEGIGPAAYRQLSVEAPNWKPPSGRAT